MVVIELRTIYNSRKFLIKHVTFLQLKADKKRKRHESFDQLKASKNVC